MSYIQIYRNLKSRFTLGLIIFTIALLLQSATRLGLLLLVIINPPRDLPLIIKLLGYDPAYVIIPDILEFIALSILVYLTRE